MHRLRFILAAILIATPFLHAQGSENKAEPTSEETTAAKPSPALKSNEPYKITITFKAMDGGKVTTQRSYVLVATTNENYPSIRDSSQVPVKAFGGNQYTYEEISTDVDFTGLKKSGDSVYLGLRISTSDFAGLNSVAGADVLPIKHRHSYQVSPTLTLGKVATVYSSTDAVNSTSVDVEVLIQPVSIK